MKLHEIDILIICAYLIAMIVIGLIPVSYTHLFNLFFDGMTGNKIYNYQRYCLESGKFNGNYLSLIHI